MSADVYLVSPEVAAASAVFGEITDPRKLGAAPHVDMPQSFKINDNLVIPPAEDGSKVEVVRGPNIKPFPINKPLAEEISGSVLLKMGDNITTDHIMPSNAKLLPYRSNIPHLSDYCLVPVDETFPKRAKEQGGGFLVGGHNYGQGSSREHAALVPLYLGIKGVVAKSFARIHMANLINSGILPLTFVDERDYDNIQAGDRLVIRDSINQLKSGIIRIYNQQKDIYIDTKLDVSERLINVLIAGGLLNFTKENKA